MIAYSRIRPPSNTATLRLAYFSPFPPARSGIADYSAELLPHLQQLAEVSLFAARPDEIEPALAHQFPVYPLADYAARRSQFDLALYQMGNSHHHAEMYPFLRRYPGIVVLHDYALHLFIADLTAGQGNYAAYGRELCYALGIAGSRLVWQNRLGWKTNSLVEQPLNNRVIDHSLGLIVHSQFVAQKIAASHPHKQVAVIPAPIETRNGRSRRNELGVDPNTVIFGSFGQVTPAKQIAQALRAFARLRQQQPNLLYLIVGEPEAQTELTALQQSLALAESVRLIGYAPTLDDFVDWLTTCDVVINLRHPTVGETSATALRAMAAAKPLIVSAQGWYQELPDAACCKVPPGDETSLLLAMRSLAASPESRQEMGLAGLTAVAQQHNPAQVAQQYIDFARQLIQRLAQKYGAVNG